MLHLPLNQRRSSQLYAHFVLISRSLLDSRSVPFTFSCICLFLQIIHVVLHWINTSWKPLSIIESEQVLTDPTPSTFLHSAMKKVKSYGGWTIYLFMVARFFGCFILLALSVYSLLVSQRNRPDVVECPEVLMIVTFVNPPFAVFLL